jgi:hypothetical protein
MKYSSLPDELEDMINRGVGTVGQTAPTDQRGKRRA